ncbi:MAG: HDOD domain-containing protein [Betaproteobacteria bacterium]|nr:HDOD domain-containing protein [Betaproteobacteria bacterium]
MLEAEATRIAASVGIPSKPELLTRLSLETSRLEPDFRRIADLIARDVGMSAAIVKTANSSLFGLRTRVHSVQQAVNFLGLRTITHLVTGLALRAAFSGPDQPALERFWDVSARVAMATAHFARRLPGMDRDEAYTYGLFQDCGIAVLLRRFPEYKQVLGIANAAVESKFTDIETEHIGVDHALIGYLLARSWGLSESVYEAIRMHHEFAVLDPDSHELSTEALNLIGAALLGERAYQLFAGKARGVEWQKAGKYVLDHFGMAPEDCDAVIADIHRAFTETA